MLPAGKLDRAGGLAIGTEGLGESEQSLTAIDRGRIVAFHRDYYRPNNAFLLNQLAADPSANGAHRTGP